MTHRWIEDPDALGRLIADLAGRPLVGLDTEFHRERTYHPQVALMQVSWRAARDDSVEVALIDTQAVDIRAFAEVLTGTATIVMHASSQDLEVLSRSCGALPLRLFDTQIASGFIGYSTPSLANLVEGVLGFRLPKGDRLADWLQRPLSADQREYAASDVAHLLDLHAAIAQRLEANGRLEWATDECQQLLERASAPRDVQEAWWRVKEARSLRWPAVGIAQALAAWRETRAAEIDQPVRFVLPDLALVAIAQRPPPDVAALRLVRGLDDRHVRNGAAKEILNVIESSRAMTREELRLPPPSDVDRELRAAVTLASAWVSQLGRQLKLDPTLIATRADLEAFLRGEPDARLGQGWRELVAGSAVRRLVAGEAALAFDGRGGLVLEERTGRRSGLN